MRRFLFATICGLWFSAGPVLAQTYELPAQNPSTAASYTYEWLYTAGICLGCLVVAFMPAKRSNLK